MNYKKNLILSGILLLGASYSHGQSLPDEINYSPYYTQYLDLKDQRNDTQSALENNRSSLEAVMKSISSKQSYISQLNSKVSNQQNEIKNLKIERKNKKDQLASINSEINSVQSKLRELNKNKASIESRITRTKDVLKPIRAKIQRAEQEQVKLNKQIKKNSDSLNSKKKSLQSKKNQIQAKKIAIISSEKKIKQLKSREVSLRQDNRKLTSEVGSLRVTISNATRGLSQLRTKAQALKQKISKQVAQLNKMIQNNADPAKISAQRTKIQASRQAYKKAQSKIATTNQEINKAKQSKKLKEQKISDNKRVIASIPGNVSAENSKQASLKNEIKTLITQTGHLNTQIANLESERSVLAKKRANTKNEISKLQKKANPYINQLVEFNTSKQRIVSKISTNEKNRTQLVSRSNRLEGRISDIKSRIPRLERAIRTAQNDIARTQSEIRSLKNQESNTRSIITSLERELRNLTAQTDSAYNAYSSRKQLYTHYEGEAKNIGENQTSQAYPAGENKGYSLAQSDSTHYSTNIAEEYGIFQAKLIGNVRAEIAGYGVGYDTGYSDSTSIEEAKTNGKVDGKSAAYKYARQILKPQYFENHMQDRINAAKTIETVSFSIAKNIGFNEIASFENSLSSIGDLTQLEINQSEAFNTSLDGSISDLLNSLGSQDANVVYYSQAKNVYSAPTEILFGSVNCNSVYNQLAHFKSICQNSYKNKFEREFLAGVSDKYEDIYQRNFESKFAQKETKVRADHYDLFYGPSYDIAFGEAKLIGKKDIYDETYAVVYEQTYKTALPNAKAVANNEAKVEVNDWIAEKPIVTVRKNELSARIFRGGEGANLKIIVKNISEVNSKNTGIVKIVRAHNATFATNTFKITSVDAQGSAEIVIPFTIDPNASGKDVLSVSAEVVLPGDKYKAKRVESVELTEKLVLNPKASSSLKYDKTPKVKGLFKYKIHSMRVKLSPVADDIAQGYKVVVKPIGSHAGRVKMKETSKNTGALAKGQEAEVSLRYTFHKKAKNETIQLEVSVFHKNLVVKKEVITLKPR